jgi:phenylacetic acid degradation operon negative regulatory protein
MTDNERPDRPLTARSVLASALLGESPPELPVGQLIRIAALFGINDNRARVALSRMVSNGELTSHHGVYRLLSSSLLQRQQRQQRSRDGSTSDWDGSWYVALIISPPADAGQRALRRSQLGQARLAERRDGVWMRPDNLGDRLRADLMHLNYSLELYRAVPDGDQRALAAELWDTNEWAKRSTTLIARMKDLPATGQDDLAVGFVLSASILRHFQADPLLPESLLPRRWPGRLLRDRYDDWNRRYRRLLGSLNTD